VISCQYANNFVISTGDLYSVIRNEDEENSMEINAQWGIVFTYTKFS
jgi:plasmid maintenance system killer protein